MLVILYTEVSFLEKLVMLANLLMGVGMWQLIRGAWYKWGVNYLLDDDMGVSRGGSDLFVAWCLNILFWLCSIILWVIYFN